MSQITSHILDLSVGRPAAGVPLSLFKLDAIDQSKVTETIGRGVTNEDGRATDLVETNIVLTKGHLARPGYQGLRHPKTHSLSIIFPQETPVSGLVHQRLLLRDYSSMACRPLL